MHISLGSSWMRRIVGWAFHFVLSWHCNGCLICNLISELTFTLDTAFYLDVFKYYGEKQLIRVGLAWVFIGCRLSRAAVLQQILLQNAGTHASKYLIRRKNPPSDKRWLQVGLLAYRPETNLTYTGQEWISHPEIVLNLKPSWSHDEVMMKSWWGHDEEDEDWDLKTRFVPYRHLTPWAPFGAKNIVVSECIWYL